MCRRVQCPSCDRPTFAGCGAHVEQVLHDVAAPDRCQCAGERRAATTTATRPRRSWFGLRR